MTDVERLQRADVITELAALASIEGDWRRLAEFRGNAFVTPEWFFAWFEHYGAGAEPYVLFAPSLGGGQLVGVLPLVAQRRGFLRILRFAGGNLGDYFHPVAQEGDDDRVAATFAAALVARRDEWRVILLENVDSTATWPNVLRMSSSAALCASCGPVTAMPYAVPAEQSWSGYLTSRSANFRGELGRKLRALQRNHELRFRRTLEPGELKKDMRTFFSLHDRRWAPRGGSSSASETARAFHEDFAARALERGWLRLWFLEVDDTAVSAWYGWRIGSHYSYYLAGFDPEWSRHSVGTLLLAHTIQEAILEGASTYDFLLGGEAYKARFATAERAVHTIALTPSFHPVRLLIAADLGLRKAVRRLPPRARGALRKATANVLELLPTSRAR